MLARWIGTFLLLATFAGLSRAEEPARPACNKKNAGQLWPDAANSDHSVRARAARCGELQICSRDEWHYRWQALTVRIDQLRGGAGLAKPAACEVSAEPGDHPSVSVSDATK
jgi:hypothetical protein